MLNGLTLAQARRFLAKVLYPLVGGLYRDDYWQGPKKVWDFLGASDIDYVIVGSQYHKDRDDPQGPDRVKTWVIELPFVDAKGKAQKITGTLTAHGAGSVKAPLDAYDMTLSVY
jgi:hypothetical protein